MLVVFSKHWFLATLNFHIEFWYLINNVHINWRSIYPHQSHLKVDDGQKRKKDGELYSTKPVSVISKNKISIKPSILLEIKFKNLDIQSFIIMLYYKFLRELIGTIWNAYHFLWDAVFYVFRLLHTDIDTYTPFVHVYI